MHCITETLSRQITIPHPFTDSSRRSGTGPSPRCVLPRCLTGHWSSGLETGSLIAVLLAVVSGDILLSCREEGSGALLPPYPSLTPSYRLDYHLPANGSLFLNTNISYATNASYLNQFAGSLLVAVNDDVSEPDGLVHVTMHHSSQKLSESTSVCLMESGQGNGLYVFVSPPSCGLPIPLTFLIDHCRLLKTSV